MNKIAAFLLVTFTLLTSCSTPSQLKKSIAYEGMYKELPLTVLLMPPLNRSTNVKATEYFYSSLSIPLINKGYYVIPPFASMDILKRESASDAALFLNEDLSKFGEIFGADIVLFTIINEWDDELLPITASVEYIVKSTKTNEILYSRKGNIPIEFRGSMWHPSIGPLVALLGITIAAVNIVATKKADIGRVCNSYTLKDFPAGKYSPAFKSDGEELAGEKEFNSRLRTNYK